MTQRIVAFQSIEHNINNCLTKKTQCIVAFQSIEHNLRALSITQKAHSLGENSVSNEQIKTLSKHIMHLLLVKYLLTIILVVSTCTQNIQNCSILMMHLMQL